MTKMNDDSSVASKLLRVVIAKSFLEIMVLCLVVTMAAFSNFSPLLRGAIDFADQVRISGWVLDPLSPDHSIEVQLFIDGKFAATGRSDHPRDDLVRAGVAVRPNHGFVFSINSLNLTNGKHTIQVYAVREAAGANKILLPVTGTPRTIEVSR